MMNFLLAPGIRLMNLLTYPRKFIVVGALSLLSLFIVSNALIEQNRTTVATAKQQLLGLEQVQRVSHLIQLMQTHRWLSAGELAGDSAYTSDKESIATELKTRIQEIENNLPDSRVLTHHWATIHDRWQYLLTKNQTLGFNDSFDSHTRLIRRTLSFQQDLADFYQLSIVADTQSHFMLESLLDQFPSIFELLGQIRALGESYLVNKNPPTLASINQHLTEIRIPIQRAREDVAKFDRTIHQNGLNIQKQAQTLLGDIQEHLKLVKHSIVEQSEPLSPEAFFQLSTKLIDSGYEFINQPLIDAIKSVLLVRVEQADRHLMFTMGIAITLFLIVLYFSVSTYFSTIRSVHSLTKATDLFGQGNYHSRAYLETKDELNHIAHSFNDMAEAFEALIAEKEEVGSKIRAILDNSPIGIWFTDTNDRYYLVNKTFCELMGVEEQTFLNAKPNSLPKLFGLNVAENCLQTNKTALNEETPTVSYETAVDVKGEKHLLEVTKVQLRNSENEVIGLIGISQNITTRRQQEDELKLANLVYQHSSEAMMLTDHENKIIAINPAFTEITGYSEHELIGRDPNILSSGKQSRKFYKDLWDELKLTGSWSGEIRNTRKNGSELVEWLSISTIYDERGEVYRRVGLFSDITEQKRNAEIILKQANYDSLTQLPNRSMFNDRLEQEIKKSQRSNLPLALIFLDLDHFKEVNDTQGHESGDLLLIEAANRLKSCVRESDTVARLGGDEFTIILPALTEPHDVEIICEKILKSLVQPFDIKDKRLYISASLGVTIYPDDGTTILDLLKNADQAMYLSKQSGRNRFRYFTPHMQQEAYRRQSLLQDLRNAIPLKQLEVYYQPIIDLESNQIHKAEALLRWKHPERGMVSPAEFIPLAEDSGLIVEIGDWIFKEVVNQVRRCQLVCQRDIQISVNKSPIQFRETKDHLDWIDYLRQHGLSGEHIAIEITEGLLMDDDDTILAQLHQFRDHNIEVAMDDFGTGYSSLSYLKKFDIDYLKIDQAFTRGIAPGTDDLALCQAIIVMAHTLGLNVIAEGIETEDQLQLLIDSGCDYAQGYYFSKPLPADDFIDLLDNSQKIDDLISKISREY